MKKNLKIFAICLMAVCAISLFAVSSYASTKSNVAGTPTPGTEKWKFKSNLSCETFSDCPAIGKDKKIYIVDGQGVVYALNPNGTLAWEKKGLGSSDGRIAIGKDGTIYLLDAYLGSHIDRSFLYAFDSLHGLQKWKFDLGEGELYLNIAIAQDGTIYAETNKALFAINPDGSQKWKRDSFTEGGNSLQTLVVGLDGTIYLVANDKNDGNFLYFINPNDGKNKKWAMPLDGVNPKLALDSAGNIVVTSRMGYTDDINLSVISPSLKEPLWDFDVEGEIASSPVIGHDGTIYFTSSGEEGKFTLYALDHKGALKWKISKDEGGCHDCLVSPAIDSEGNVICPMGCHVYAIDSKGNEKWSFFGDINGFLYGDITIGDDGTIYSILSAYDGNFFYAINSSSTGLDSQAPWPKYNKDIYNSGNAGFSSK